jgi:hypothetical protein
LRFRFDAIALCELEQYRASERGGVNGSPQYSHARCAVTIGMITG